MRSEVLGVVSVTILGSWLVITSMWAVPKLQDVLECRVRFLSWIVPRWNLFAPVPGMHDFRLLVRDQSLDGSLTPWREIQVMPPRRGPSTVLWNAGQRRKKALIDVAQELLRAAMRCKHDLELVQMSLPYLILLTYVSESSSEFTRRRQFVVVKTSMREPDPEVVFISGLHDVRADAGAGGI